MLNHLFRLTLCLFLFLTVLPFARADEPIILPNGLRILLRERHEKPLVALDLWIHAGSREEHADEEACAHLLEHTLFKGTATRGSNELDFALESLGGVFRASTGPDYARYGTTLPAAGLEAALPLFADLVRNATLPAVEVERERGPILDELALHGDEITARLVDRAYTLAFEKHPYRHSPGGTPDTIRTRKPEALLAFYHRTYAPERTTLVLVGDFETAKARAAIEKSFGDWKQSVLTENPPVEPELTVSRKVTESVNGKVGRIAIGFRVPPAADTETVCALRLIAALLGESDGYGAFRTKALNGTDAITRYTPRLDSSLFLLTADIPADSDASTMEDALHSAIEHLQNTLVTLPQWNAARLQVIGQIRYEGETNAGLAQQLGYADLTHGDAPDVFQKAVMRVKPQDIPKIARRIFDWNRAVTVVFTAEEKNAK